MGWELIEGDVDSPVDSVIERMEVPGGWLYRSAWSVKHRRYSSTEACGMAFVPFSNQVSQDKANAAAADMGRVATGGDTGHEVPLPSGYRS